MSIDKRWKKFLLLGIGGVLTGLTLAFPRFGFLEWLTLVPVGVFLLCVADSDKIRARSMYGYGFFFFMCFYAVVFHWFINLYPLEFIDGMTKWAAVVVVLAGCLGLSALQALFGGLMFVTVRYLFKTHIMRERPMLRPFAVAGLWAIYEWSQNIGWWGVPWGRLPIGQSEYVVGLQTASLVGSYFITAIIVAVNLCIAYAIVNRKSTKLMAIFTCAILVFQYGAGAILYLVPTDSEKTVKVAAIQGNISSNEKWSFSNRSRTFEVYEEYTLKAAENGAQIVVWPETALPYEVTPTNNYGNYCSELAREAGVTILVGAFTKDAENNSYNSIICVLPDGSFHETVYSKQRLVPFGEFVPMRGLFQILVPPLAELVMSDDDIVAGTGSQVLALDGLNIGSLICFDSIYDHLARDSVRDGAQIIALSTNDSWFTDSVALYMHNAQAQIRAIENGRYVVRSANTGISTVITSKGEIVEQLEPLVEGMVISDVSVNSHSTLYSMIGNFVLFIFGMLLSLVFIADIKKNTIKRFEKKREDA